MRCTFQVDRIIFLYCCDECWKCTPLAITHPVWTELHWWRGLALPTHTKLYSISNVNIAKQREFLSLKPSYFGQYCLCCKQLSFAESYVKFRCSVTILSLLPSVLWHCWLGDRKGVRPVESWVLVCWWWWFARLTAPVNTTSIILSSNRIQNGDILVLANSDIPVTETQTDTEMIDISKTHTETNTEKIFNTDTIYI